MNPAQANLDLRASAASLQLDLFAADPMPAGVADVPPAAGAAARGGEAGPAPHPPATLPPPARTVDGQRQIVLGGQTIVYRFRRSSRRTIGLVVDDTGLAITAPRWVTLAEVESTLREKQRWIMAKLGEMQARRARPVVPPIAWTDGERVPYLGGFIRFVLTSRTGALHFDAEAGVLALGLPAIASPQQIKDRVQGWLQHQARALFMQRLDHYAERLGVRVASLALSSATTRWGSASADGRIRLNWRLIHFPLSVIDYVAAHELAHLKEMNHGPRFWRTVASIFPDYDRARDTLREPPPELLPEF